jgi:hypothetical protein
MKTTSLRGHRFIFHKLNLDEKLTLEFKKKHREEIEKLMVEYLKNNVIKKPKIDWVKINYGNRKKSV